MVKTFKAGDRVRIHCIVPNRGKVLEEGYLSSHCWMAGSDCLNRGPGTVKTVKSVDEDSVYFTPTGCCPSKAVEPVGPVQGLLFEMPEPKR